MAKADITINSIMMIFIAIISIVLLLGMFSAKLPAFGKQLYCKTIGVVASSAFLPEGMRQEDSYCKTAIVLCNHKITPEVYHLSTFGEETTLLLNFSISNYSFELNLSGMDVIRGSVKLTTIEPVVNATIRFGNASWLDANFTELNSTNSPLVVERNLTVLLNYTRTWCNTTAKRNNCSINLTVFAFNGSLVVHELDLVYRKCAVEKTLFGEALACWEQAKWGKSARDFSCCAVEIPDSCAFANVTESSFTQLLQQTPGACEALPNSDFGCGTEDRLALMRNFSRSGISVFIEYKNKRLVLS